MFRIYRGGSQLIEMNLSKSIIAAIIPWRWVVTRTVFMARLATLSGMKIHLSGMYLNRI